MSAPSPFRPLNRPRSASTRSVASPDWLRCFASPVLGRRFAVTLQGVLEERLGSDAMFDPIEGVAVMSGGEILGFANLARRAARAPERDWGRMVGLHLDDLTGALPTLVDELLNDPELAAGRLRRRLIDPASFETVDRLVGRPISPTCHAVPVLDLGLGVAVVGAATLQRWDRSLEEVWTQAAANDLAALPTDLLDLDGGLAPLLVLQGDLCTTGAALALDQLVEIGPGGLLVAAPTADRLILARLPDSPAAHADTVIDAASSLLAAVAGASGRSPNPVTSELLWFGPDGDLVPAVHIAPGRGLVVDAPGALGAVLRSGGSGERP